jgi:hypothetical protein
MCAFACSFDDNAMTAMHAVEIANRHHRTGERTTIDALGTAARDMELLGRGGSFHRISRRLRKIAVIDLHIFHSSAEHSERGYG